MAAQGCVRSSAPHGLLRTTDSLQNKPPSRALTSPLQNLSAKVRGAAVCVREAPDNVRWTPTPFITS